MEEFYHYFQGQFKGVVLKKTEITQHGALIGVVLNKTRIAKKGEVLTLGKWENIKRINVLNL